LDGGFAYERAGLTAKAIAAYQAALATGANPLERAEAHMRLARVHRSASEWEDAVREAREALRLAEAAGAADLAAEAMNVEVGVHQLRGEFEAGERLALRALERARAPRVRGILLQNRGAMAAQRRDFVAAGRLFDESVTAFAEAGYELGMAIALNNASAAARDAGEPVRAIELGRQAAELARRLDAIDVLVLAAQNQAHALATLGDTDEAEALIGEVFGHFAATRNVLRQAECLEIIGRLHELRPEYRDTATRCFELARTLASRVGARTLAERLAPQRAPS
jgi:tetratricopeptide (TPR) repeat protein